jgi:Domain of unknown function (DUF4920)
MKALTIILTCFILGFMPGTQAQHGKVYGTKPTPTQVIDAQNLEAFMGNKTRVKTAIKGPVLKVTKQQGGWFDIDAGKGKIIAAHFSKYDITLPLDLKGKYIIAEGIAQKQFMADDMQHFAGDTVTGKKQHDAKANPNDKLTFEVSGLIVE